MRAVEAIVEDGNVRLLERLDVPEGTRLVVVALGDVPTTERSQRSIQALQRLRGLGKDAWAGVDPDEYVRELRKG